MQDMIKITSKQHPNVTLKAIPGQGRPIEAFANAFGYSRIQ